MSRYMAGDDLGKQIVVIILAVLLVIASAIIISRQLFPLFLALSALSFLALIISILIEVFFRDHDYSEITDYVSFYIAIVFALSILGMFVTFQIGYGLAGTTIGQTALEVYGVKQEVSESIENAINQVVNESCQTLPKESCDNLRLTAETAKSVQEITDLAKKLKTANDIANKLNDNN